MKAISKFALRENLWPSVMKAGMILMLRFHVIAWDILHHVFVSYLHKNFKILSTNLIFIGGEAVHNLKSTVPIVLESIVCNDTVSMFSRCSVQTPPSTSRCLSDATDNAAGIRCIFGNKSACTFLAVYIIVNADLNIGLLWLKIRI